MTRLRPCHLLLLTLGSVLALMISTSPGPGRAENSQQNVDIKSAITATRAGRHPGTSRHRVPQTRSKSHPFHSESHREKRNVIPMQQLNARSDQTLNTKFTSDTKVHSASGNGHSTATPQDKMPSFTRRIKSSAASDGQVTPFSNAIKPSNSTVALKISVLINEITKKPHTISARSVDSSSSAFGDHVEEYSTEFDNRTIPSTCATLGCGLGIKDSLKRTCFCDTACYVYNTCCSDLEKVCPQIVKEASEVLTPALYKAHYTCYTAVGRYAVDMCPNGGSGEPQHYYDDFVLSVLYTGTKVFDSYTGVLYITPSVYDCYKTNQSKPVYWRVVVEASGDVDFRNNKELTEFIRSQAATYYYAPPDESFSGQYCSSPTHQRQFPFSILVDIAPKQSVQVTYNGGKIAGWKTLSCDIGTSNTCSHQDCYGYGAVSVDGQCPLDAYVTVQVSHPPQPLSAQCIKDIAAFLNCVLQRHLAVPPVYTSDFADSNLEIPSDDPAVQPEQSYFTFKFIILTLATESTIQKLLEDAVAYFYVQADLVFGEKNLQFYINEEFGAELFQDLQEDVDTPTMVPPILTSASSFSNLDSVSGAKASRLRIKSSKSGHSFSEAENFRNSENDRPGCSTPSSSNDEEAANGSGLLSSTTTNPDCEQTPGHIRNIIPTTKMTPAAATTIRSRLLTSTSSTTTTTGPPTTTSAATDTMCTTKLTRETINEYISSSQQVHVTTCSRPALQNASQPTTTTTTTTTTTIFPSARLCVKVYFYDAFVAGGICPASDIQPMQRPTLSFGTCLGRSQSSNFVRHRNICSIQKLEPLLLTMWFLATACILMSHVVWKP